MDYGESWHPYKATKRISRRADRIRHEGHCFLGVLSLDDPDGDAESYPWGVYTTIRGMQWSVLQGGLRGVLTTVRDRFWEEVSDQE